MLDFFNYLYMKHFLFLFIGLVLIACGANNSNPAKKRVNAESDSVSASAKADTLAKKTDSAAVKKDTMTAEEVAVAASIGALKATKMAPDTFMIYKKVAAQDVSSETYVMEADSVPLCGVVSAAGKYYVPVRYHDVRQLERDAFIGEIKVDIDDNKLNTPNVVALYQVIYQGKPVGGMSVLRDVKPIHHRGKVAGFLKTLHIEEADKNYIFFIDVHGKGWDILKDIRGTSYPKFEHYRVQKNVLVLWGGAKNPEDLMAFYPEDRSLYKVDLRNGRVLENPFIPTE